MFPFYFTNGLPCLFIGIIMLVVSLFVFITGANFVGTHLLPVFKALSMGGAILSLVVCLPLTFSKKYRVTAGVWLTRFSWLFGITAWFMGLVMVYQTWGMLAVLLGLLLAGIGVIPIGMLAALWTGETVIFGQILLWTIVAFLSRSAGKRILLQYQAEESRKTFFRTFYFRPGQENSYFFRNKKTTASDDDTIDAEYEIMEPPKKEIDHDSF